MDYSEILKTHARLVKHVLEPDPKVFSPHTRQALDDVEALARLAYAYESAQQSFAERRD